MNSSNDSLKPLFLLTLLGGWLATGPALVGCFTSGSNASGSSDPTLQEGPVVAINEVDCRGREWVELVLVSHDTIDLSGYILTDDPSDESHLYLFPEGTTLAVGEYLVIDEESDHSEGFPFGIKCGQDTVYLLEPVGNQADVVAVPETLSGQTWGRLPDGTGTFQTTTPSAGEANLVYVDPTTVLFDPYQVGQVALTLDQDALSSLAEEPYEWVVGNFTYTSPDGTSEGPLAVGIRLKGQAGSLRSLEDKPAFKILMDYSQSDQEFHGLERLTFNNLVQDETMIREALVYQLFRDFGVPAPRVGYVQITLNGEEYGLYANIETPDREFLSRWFDTTDHLYEGCYGADLIPDAVDHFEVDVGDESDQVDLLALVDALHSESAIDLVTATQDYVDWDEALRMMAIEVWAGHWDGYAATVNNYFLHEDDDGMFSLLPWGADQAFTSDWNLHMGHGLLFRRCMLDADCRERYDDILLELRDSLEEYDLDGQAESLSESLAHPIEQDSHRPFDDEQVQEGYSTLLTFLDDRAHLLDDMAPCLQGLVPDEDGDGFTCDMDCDETDPSIHFGAPEVCDGIDNDCSGEPDDSPECPDCTEITLEDHNYLVCTRHRPIWEAFEHCAEHGMGLVKLESAEEEQWLVQQAQEIRPGPYWIGLHIPENQPESSYLWWDGTEPDYTHWSEEIPFDGPEARCVVMLEGGEWMPVECGHPARTLCEEGELLPMDH